MMKQPNSAHCFGCGVSNPLGLNMRFYMTNPGEITSEYTVPYDYEGYPGVVHGGIVAAMLDEVCSRAHMTGDPPRFMYTARLEVRYRKTVPIDQQLRIVGRVGKYKSRSATSKAVIHDSDGTILAEAEALLIDLPIEVFGPADLDALGWKVYPD
jgi:acyl-coenzyme A thioesterase PaaI-like protein